MNTPGGDFFNLFWNVGFPLLVLGVLVVLALLTWPYLVRFVIAPVRNAISRAKEEADRAWDNTDNRKSPRSH